MSFPKGGIPEGARWTPVPDLLFAELIPELEDPLTLKVAFILLWRIHRRERGAPPVLRVSDALEDAGLRGGAATLGIEDEAVEEAIESSIAQLVELGLLLELRVAGEEGPERWLLVNGREGRAARDRLVKGDLVLPERRSLDAPSAAERASIFELYEENIGMLTPMLAEELKDAATEYPENWIREAIRLAVENNARKWAYVRAILERWQRDGRAPESRRDQGEDGDHATDRRGDQAAQGRDRREPYAAYIER